MQMVPLTRGLKVSVDVAVGSLEATGQQDKAASAVASVLDTIKNALPSWEALSDNSTVSFITDGHYLPGRRQCFYLFYRM